MKRDSALASFTSSTAPPPPLRQRRQHCIACPVRRVGWMGGVDVGPVWRMYCFYRIPIYHVGDNTGFKAFWRLPEDTGRLYRKNLRRLNRYVCANLSLFFNIDMYFEVRSRGATACVFFWDAMLQKICFFCFSYYNNSMHHHSTFLLWIERLFVTKCIRRVVCWYFKRSQINNKFGYSCAKYSLLLWVLVIFFLSLHFNLL